ncbi:FAD-dependent oxidoreductase [Phenylobacterium sp.]|uniref:NAD(P)/FAD-dependent oxidoreductase n=1 Tax=Phenylobacterium sp. TaxID=1871053 RepID=UPI0028974ED0|nr:FAD-dependent oxidoreductase [Phenylobacterium sp.]
MALTRPLDLRGGRPCWRPEEADAAPSDDLAPDAAPDVAVIGAGVMGAMLAERLTREGRRVAVLDRRKPSLGATSASTALVMWAADTPLTHLAEQIGWERAARRWRRVHAAVQALDADIRALAIDCAWIARPELYLDGDLLDEAGLQGEAAARRRAGLPSAWLAAAEVGRRFDIPARPAILSGSAFEVDPVALTLGLLARAQARGASVTYPVDVVGLESGAHEVGVHLADGRVLRAGQVVLATGYEAARPALPGSFDLTSSFAIATAPGVAPRWGGNALIWEAAESYLYARATRDGRVIVGGEDEPFADPDRRDRLIPAKAERLARRGADLIGGGSLAPDCAWGATFGTSPDGLPALGPVRGQPRVWLASGFGGNGVSFARLGAELICGQLAGAPADADFSPYRFETEPQGAQAAS